jgi:hypothetical protein
MVARHWRRVTGLRHRVTDINQPLLRGGRSPARLIRVREGGSAGWALAYRRYSMDYVAAEDEARKAKRGMWRGTFVKPWEWRALAPPSGRHAPSASAVRRDAWGMVKG